ncbi:hypothetical protein FQA39_LY02732 [Lamprigera yunnana]|nr:hypothetical protein FQA39_LY02732 [Lamprigera yunnana]
MQIKKNNGKKPQVSKRKKEKAPLSSEDEDEEEWIESRNILDDVINEVEDLKVDDYILALFVSTGKRAVVHYKYVAKILQVLQGDDFEVQCLKSLDETKTTFKFIENDQCVIAKKEILGRLPDPQLVQFGRILKTVFPAEVENDKDANLTIDEEASAETESSNLRQEINHQRVHMEILESERRQLCGHIEDLQNELLITKDKESALKEQEKRLMQDEDAHTQLMKDLSQRFGGRGGECGCSGFRSLHKNDDNEKCKGVLDKQQTSIMAEKRQFYKYCLVPMCINTSVTSPNKIFFSVPKDPDMRNQWCAIMKREEKNPPLSSTTSLHCCEDHFDLANDMENYYEYKLMGKVNKNFLRKGVLPHIFHCQDLSAAPVSKRRAIARTERRLESLRRAQNISQDEEVIKKVEEEPASYEMDADASMLMQGTVTVPFLIKLNNWLPFERNRRTKWLEACQRDLHDISSNSNALHVCEDHFNLEEDMDNYMRFKLMGGIKKMKQCVVPHIFDCQTNKNGASAHTARAAALKKVKRQPVQKAVASTSNSTEPLKDQNISGIKSNMITMGPSYEYDNHTNEVSAHTSKRTLPKIRSKGVQSQKCLSTNSEQVDSMKWTYTLEEQLITLVQQHECLYDVNNPNYGNIQMKDESWFEIGRKLECKGEDCKDRWGLLRSYYRKALQRKKAITRKSKMWKFEPQMEFLQQYLQEQKTTSTVQEITKMDEFQDEFDSNEGEDEMHFKQEAEEIHIKEEEIHIKEEDVFEMQSSPVGSPFVPSPIGNGLHEHEQSSTSEMVTSVQKFLPPSQFHQESEEISKSQRDVQKKKLMIFFDYVAESMLKFSELEQVEIKKDIFNIINQKELQLLNVKKDVVPN